MDREEYIFNGIFDVVCYFFVYLLIPIVQITVGLFTESQYVHFFAAISMIGLFYDCFTRYDDRTMEPTARRKMLVIGLSTMVLLACSVIATVSFASGLQVPTPFNLAYSIIVFPMIVWIHDGWYVTKIKLKLQ